MVRGGEQAAELAQVAGFERGDRGHDAIVLADDVLGAAGERLAQQATVAAECRHVEIAQGRDRGTSSAIRATARPHSARRSVRIAAGSGAEAGRAAAAAAGEPSASTTSQTTMLTPSGSTT